MQVWHTPVRQLQRVGTSAGAPERAGPLSVREGIRITTQTRGLVSCRRASASGPEPGLRAFVDSTPAELAEECAVLTRAISALWPTPVSCTLGGRPDQPRELYRCSARPASGVR